MPHARQSELRSDAPAEVGAQTEVCPANTCHNCQRRSLMKTFLLFLIAANVANAQGQPKFEVASVKRTERCFTGNSAIDPGSVTLKGLPLKGVLMEAFKVKMDQIEGPSWMDTECFEISAKIPQGVAADQLPAMLQALLAERFKL